MPALAYGTYASAKTSCLIVCAIDSPLVWYFIIKTSLLASLA